MSLDILPIVILNGRPASGKSEILDYLKKVPLDERVRRFHIGEFDEFDDFPILWERFEDDDIWEMYGYPRLISDTHFEYEGKRDSGYVFKNVFFWHYLIRKLSENYERRLRDHDRYHETHTAMFEFARGSQHGGFAAAYPYLSASVLARACAMYIHVTWEESRRKNERRRNPAKPDSILEHALEMRKMEFLYKESDWREFSAPDPEYLRVRTLPWPQRDGKETLAERDFRVPYAVFENMPEKTDKPEVLGAHLEEVCARLWKLHRGRGRASG